MSKPVGGKRHIMNINGHIYVLDGAQAYIRKAGHCVLRWHRYIKGWCQEFGKVMTFCLGVVKDLREINSWVEFRGGEALRQARLLFERWLERVGANHALSILSLANFWA